MSQPEIYIFPPAGTFVDLPGIGQAEIVDDSGRGPRKTREAPSQPDDGEVTFGNFFAF